MAMREAGGRLPAAALEVLRRRWRSCAGRLPAGRALEGRLKPGGSLSCGGWSPRGERRLEPAR